MAGDMPRWPAGPVPIAVVMITLNEAHNMAAVLDNLAGFAAEVVVLDSFSADDTVGIALSRGVRVVQRQFRGFGDQWNAALSIPVASPWTMKLDPDERLTPELKAAIARCISEGSATGFSLTRQLWFMGRAMPVRQTILRGWRTGTCRFSDVAVNEYPIVDGPIVHLDGVLEHLDSPSLEHWLDKQNGYTTGEALIAHRGSDLAFPPRLFGSGLERRMWLKKNFRHVPFRYLLLFLYNWLWLGAWRAGRAGWIWARLRSDIMRWIDYKRVEMELLGHEPVPVGKGKGLPDPRVPQMDRQ
jgi:glycosyltransferase involved in cell wall biosynthesis